MRIWEAQKHTDPADLDEDADPDVDADPDADAYPDPQNWKTAKTLILGFSSTR
jgi:hypothetical protein